MDNLDTAMLDRMELAELAELDPETLDALFWKVNEELTIAKRHDKLMSDVLEARYGAKASEALLADNRDTGTIHLTDGRFDVAVTRPKRVKWDDAELRKALDAMSPEDARHYAKITIKVDERKFDGAPPAIQQLLAPARTIEAGKTVFGLKEKEAA